MDERDGQEHLWIGEDERTSQGSRSHRWRNVGVTLACVTCVAAISVPLAVTLSSHGARAALSPPSKQATRTHRAQGQAQRAVLSALSATTSSGSFNVTYEFDPSTAPTVSTTTTTSTCMLVPNPSVGSDSSGGGGPQSEVCQVSSPGTSDTTITGQGTIDTDPFGMVATSDVTGLGEITLRDNGTDIWEFGGGDYGLSPQSGDTGPGSSLSGFAGLVEGSLGLRQGALAMGGLSSPTGYLDLDQSMITSADETGTGTVDGVAVTVYQLSITAAQEANVSDTTAEEAKAISAANAVLQAQGYTGTTVQVSIDASGYIRQTRSVAHFSDGSTQISQSTFSDFGCAGTVLMPGQSGATAPPAGCVSPDTGVAPATTTTTAPPSTTSTTSTTAPPSTTSTTIASG
jgi:hypothetical protein